MKEYRLKSSLDLTTTGDSFKIDYERELNPAQMQAVTSINGPVLCVAGAGSGKTRTLVYRVARMVESGIHPENILLLTFTRKAALNMLERAAQLVGAGGQKVSGGTYHSFANMILRRYAGYLNISPSFVILDESDATDIISLIRTESGHAKKENRFPQKKTLHEIWSKSRNQVYSVEEIVKRDFEHFMYCLNDMTDIFKKYEEFKHANHLMDFDDLLINLKNLLSENSEIRRMIADRFRYVMADEYQDTNPAQAEITILLGKEHGNVMVVGDEAQSIYSFRGACFKNIIDFPNFFSECKIIRLEENYRSTEAILCAANSLMQHAQTGFQKHLFTKRKKGEKPALVVCSDGAEQAQFVAQRVLETHEEGVPFSRIAVLFRSSFHAFSLELELKKRNIPYVKWGGFKFLEAAHIKDVTAHLRVIQNPLDRISWHRILLLVEGIGTKSVSIIYQQIKESQDPFDFSNVKTSSRVTMALAALSNMLKRVDKKKNLSPDTLIGLIVEYYSVILRTLYDDYPRRLKDLDQLAAIAAHYDDLIDFLNDLSLEPPKNSIDNILSVDHDEDLLVLSTIHSAKGLEWHSVHVIEALDGRFPSFSAFKGKDEMEEERRLMYVAMTRAQENLYISYPLSTWDHAVGGLLTKPSRFIEEIDRNSLEKWELKRK